MWIRISSASQEEESGSGSLREPDRQGFWNGLRNGKRRGAFPEAEKKKCCRGASEGAEKN